jgi:hypothetical protein
MVKDVGSCTCFRGEPNSDLSQPIATISFNAPNVFSCMHVNIRNFGQNCGHAGFGVFFPPDGSSTEDPMQLALQAVEN